jgi:hypothetical protein
VRNAYENILLLIQLLHPWTFPCPLYQKLFVPIRDESDRRLMSKYKNLVDFVQPHLGLPQGQAVKIMDMMHLRHIMPEAQMFLFSY